MTGKLRSAIAAAVVLPAVSGCVAAAIPVIAAGGLVKAQADGRGPPRDNRPRVALPAEPVVPAARAAAAAPGPIGPSADAPGPIVRDYAFADGSTVTVTNGLTGAGRAAPPPSSVPPAAAVSPAMGAADSDADLPKVTLLKGVTELPAPGAAPPRARAAAPAAAFADFAAFARRQAAIPAAGAERPSAMLVDSGRLAPETRLCSIHPSAILIDLDPAGGLIDPDAAPAADPALANDLAELRRAGVEIGWISGRTADRAGAIRRALAESGLDPDGRDQLVLLRFPEERKQTRREDFAKSHCVLAIAGDERADFDELFAYLRDPAAATPLDALIGKGWFLVPPPLD